MCAQVPGVGDTLAVSPGGTDVTRTPMLGSGWDVGAGSGLGVGHSPWGIELDEGHTLCHRVFKVLLRECQHGALWTEGCIRRCQHESWARPLCCLPAIVLLFTLSFQDILQHLCPPTGHLATVLWGKPHAAPQERGTFFSQAHTGKGRRRNQSESHGHVALSAGVKNWPRVRLGTVTPVSTRPTRLGWAQQLVAVPTCLT